MKKKISYLLLSALSILFFTQCENTDNLSTNESLYLGEWIKTSETKSECKNKQSDGTKQFSCSEAECYKLTLKVDDEYEMIAGDLFEIGKWNASDSTITFCPFVEADSTGAIDQTKCVKKTVKIQENTLTATYKNTGTGCKSIEVYKRKK